MRRVCCNHLSLCSHKRIKVTGKLSAAWWCVHAFHTKSEAMVMMECLINSVFKRVQCAEQCVCLQSCGLITLKEQRVCKRQFWLLFKSTTKNALSRKTNHAPQNYSEDASKVIVMKTIWMIHALVEAAEFRLSPAQLVCFTQCNNNTLRQTIMCVLDFKTLRSVAIKSN